MALTKDKKHMSQSPQKFPSGGWFLSGAAGSAVSRCSIGAALQLGQVMRHVNPGNLWTPDKGPMSYEEAVYQGLCDQAAIDFIDKQVTCYGQDLLRVISHTPSRARPGTMAVFDGTPVGDIMKALIVWGRNRESVDEQFKLATAIDTALKARAQ